MARNKDSKFGVADGFDFRDEYTQVVQEEHKEQVVQQAQEEQEESKNIGTTQGKKGLKLKRINMAFSDDNHKYITFESRRRGLSATAFVNMIIDEYKSR